MIEFPTLNSLINQETTATLQEINKSASDTNYPSKKSSKGKRPSKNSKTKQRPSSVHAPHSKGTETVDTQSTVTATPKPPRSPTRWEITPRPTYENSLTHSASTTIHNSQVPSTSKTSARTEFVQTIENMEATLSQIKDEEQKGKLQLDSCYWPRIQGIFTELLEALMNMVTK